MRSLTIPMVGKSFNPSIKDLFFALQRVTRHIIDFRHEAYLDGVVASRWTILDMLAKEYRKQFDTKSCSACGREIDLSRTPYFCPFCGQPLGLASSWPAKESLLEDPCSLFHTAKDTGDDDRVRWLVQPMDREVGFKHLWRRKD